jgi:hypothetical protein
MKKLKITYFNDPGHGWYSVKKSLLNELNLLKEISHFSYEKGGTVYLEEDCDFSLFLNKFKSLNENYKELITIKSSYKEKSPIRNYRRFTIDTLS